MVDLSDQINETEDGNYVLSLPLGPTIKQNTVVTNTALSLTASEFNEQRSTDSGWPTVITGDVDDEDENLGAAFYYPGIWNNNNSIQEIDCVIDSEEKITGVVTFSTADQAKRRGNYQIREYNGYELVDWSDWHDMNFEEEIKDYFTQNITPIIHDADGPSLGAVAIQQGEYISEIKNLFSLLRFNKIEDRVDVLRSALRRDESVTDEFDHIVETYFGDNDNHDDENSNDNGDNENGSYGERTG